MHFLTLFGLVTIQLGILVIAIQLESTQIIIGCSITIFILIFNYTVVERTMKNNLVASIKLNYKLSETIEKQLINQAENQRGPTKNDSGTGNVTPIGRHKCKQ